MFHHTAAMSRRSDVKGTVNQFSQSGHKGFAFKKVISEMEVRGQLMHHASEITLYTSRIKRTFAVLYLFPLKRNTFSPYTTAVYEAGNRVTYMLVVVIMTQLSCKTNRKIDDTMASCFKYSTGISIRVFTQIGVIPFHFDFEICYVVALFENPK